MEQNVYKEACNVYATCKDNVDGDDDYEEARTVSSSGVSFTRAAPNLATVIEELEETSTDDVTTSSIEEDGMRSRGDEMTSPVQSRVRTGTMKTTIHVLSLPLQPPGGIPEGLKERGKSPEKQMADSNPTRIPWTENLQRLEKTDATVMDQRYISEKKSATTDVNRPSFPRGGAACIADGGTLAMPRDAGVNAFLISLIDSAKFKFANFWFGLHSQRENGKWDWIDGTPLGTNFSMWAEGQPSDTETGIQRCVMYWGINQNLWNDYGCVGTANFICQIIP
uniref:C-type lectin domain-containing protein n=1 Tax=Branchiostoma floridae TaxID=7739 RepID=C3YI47_BRAFL|eukprot:XP_002604173.1 hypothetical protein BRAFLDRAFT_73484 [Branchiostoma floridae]